MSGTREEVVKPTFGFRSVSFKVDLARVRFLDVGFNAFAGLSLRYDGFYNIVYHSVLDSEYLGVYALALISCWGRLFDFVIIIC